jgi:hypothetical protein
MRLWGEHDNRLSSSHGADTLKLPAGASRPEHDSSAREAAHAEDR